MGFIITDLADDKRVLFVNFWNWRPTVELIRSMEVVDSARLELMHLQCVGTTVSEDEARKIAQSLRAGVLTNLHGGERVELDLSVTSEPDDGVFHHGADFDRNYSASLDWLTRFAQFCLECRGFSVL
jgi:hypothetical protein